MEIFGQRGGTYGERDLAKYSIDKTGAKMEKVVKNVQKGPMVEL